MPTDAKLTHMALPSNRSAIWTRLRPPGTTCSNDELFWRPGGCR